MTRATSGMDHESAPLRVAESTPTPARDATVRPRRYRWIDNEDAPGGRQRVLVHVHSGTGEEGYIARWTSACSGCFEFGDYGGLAHHYPYDEKAGCRIGSGCEECGYTGKRRDSWFIPFTQKEPA